MVHVLASGFFKENMGHINVTLKKQITSFQRWSVIWGEEGRGRGISRLQHLLKHQRAFRKPA